MNLLNPLYDASWTLVFKCLNLNERRAVRLTCKLFKELCDLIQIDKLVIYRKAVPLAGLLEPMNEPYGLEHTAYVLSLSKFFNNNQIARQMKSIRALVIHGNLTSADVGIEEVDLRHMFNELNYLEIHSVNFLRPIILWSTKLEYLILDAVNMRPLEQIGDMMKRQMTGAPVSVSWFAMGLEQLESRRLKHLTITTEVDPMPLCEAIESHFFDCLEDANLCLVNLFTIKKLAERRYCPNLRKLNITKCDELKEFVDDLRNQNLGKLFSSWNTDLEVYLYGLPFSAQSKSKFLEFLSPISEKISVLKTKLSLDLDEQVNQHINEWNEMYSLNEFYKSVDEIRFYSGEHLNRAIFKKFRKCGKIYFISEYPNPADFEDYLHSLPNLRLLSLICKFDQAPLYGNQLLDLIAEKCPQLEDLTFESWEMIDFNFLFKMQRLRKVMIILAFEFPRRTLIDLLHNCRDLVKLDIYFVNRNRESRSELSAFMAQVNEMFRRRFRARKLGFRVEVHPVCREDGTEVNQYLRYALKEDDNQELLTITQKLVGITHYNSNFLQDLIGQTRISNFIKHNA